MLDREVKLPPGYYITWGGTFENLERATSRLLIVVPLALFLIFVLLFTTFGVGAAGASDLYGNSVRSGRRRFRAVVAWYAVFDFRRRWIYRSVWSCRS